VLRIFRNAATSSSSEKPFLHFPSREFAGRPTNSLERVRNEQLSIPYLTVQRKACDL